MKPTRILACAAAVTALLLGGCKAREEPVAGATAQNPLLAHVPADTPYVFANLEATPAEVVDAYLARFAPTLELAQDMIGDIRIEVNTDATPGHRSARLVAAVLAELDGKLNRAGLESLGFSLESHKAFYGIGAFPVMRIALKDTAALRAAIARIEAAAGIELPVLHAGDTEFWRISDGDNPIGVYLAILADHFAAGVFPVAAEAEFLPEFLGQAMPPDSMAQGAALARLNRDKGFTGYGSGFVDLQKLAAEFLDGKSATLDLLGGTFPYDPGSLEPICVAEARSLLAHAPRFVMGVTELTTSAVGVRYQLELDGELAGRLADLVADVPVADDGGGQMFAASLGIRAGRLRELLLEKTTALVEAPFQCPVLADFNEAARNALTQMNKPMPPFIGNLNGFRLSIEDVDLENPSPETARGMLALEVDKPQVVIGMAQMFVPGVEELGIEPGGEPVALPEELLSITAGGMQLYAAMSKDAIGLALGPGQQAKLAQFMEATGDNQGTFLSVSYDMAAHMEFQARMHEKLAGMNAEGGEEAPPELQDTLDRLRTIEQSYKDMLGRARMDIRFTAQGLEIDSRMTFR